MIFDPSSNPIEARGVVDHTVIVYSHNHGRFIAGCIESLLHQTVSPAEIVVYDAGSKDGSTEILASYRNRICLLCGPAHASEEVTEAQALQNAFEHAHGRIIFLVEGCDRSRPDKIERYLAAFERHPDAAVVQAPLDRIDDGDNPFGATFHPRYHVANHLREIYRRQDVDFFYPMSGLAFSRYYLERVLPFDLADKPSLWTDARLCIPAAYYGGIVTLPDALSERRGSFTSPTGSSAQRIRQTFRRAEVFNAFCRQYGLRTISPWRNYRLYLQIMRLLFPDSVFRFFQRKIRPLFERV